MKKAVIWDLDGTLFDSYGVIVESLFLTFQELNIPASREAIHRHAIAFSIKSLFTDVAEKYGVSPESLHQRYSELSQSKYLEIKCMDHAREVLCALSQLGVEHYVYTHRGRTTIPVLQNLELTGFFLDIVTSQSGFPRKPAPDGILYLMEKNGLSPQDTYYVGDRALDMECAKNAGIDGILFQKEESVDVSSGAESYVVNDLLEILNIV